MAVIIDVFRAFTTAAVALSNGAERIVMVGDLDEALALRESGLGRYCMGERRGVRPDRFDFGNSPAEIAGRRFDGETLIQTTSNGTRGILAASRAARVYAGALVTAEATVRAVRSGAAAEVALVAMGEKDWVRTEEDDLCALYLRARLLGRSPDREALRRLVETMSSRSDTATLSREDMDACLAIDAFGFAVRVRTVGGLQIATAERA
ncbi:MAG: 2-phosphosulfolactate phosphatase [Caulobacter sp.]|nr:2-phosphosulfolactate phosphatase [Caulobacter sp.]